MNKISPTCDASLAPAGWLSRLPLPALETLMVVAWSSGFVGMRYSADYAPVFLVVFWRCALICVCLFPWVAREIRKAPRAALLRQAVFGLLGLAGYLAGISKGIELGVPAGLSALIANLLPVGTVVISTLFFGERHAKRVWAGIAIGLAGVLIVSRDAFSLASTPLWAFFLPVAGMASLAVATLWQARTAARAGSLSVLSTLWIHCAVTGLVFLCLQKSQGTIMPSFTTGFAISVGWTAVLSTLGGYGLYWLCLRRSSTARVTSVLFLSPSVTLAWAWAMFGEPLSWTMFFGTVLSGLGIMVMSHRAPAARP